MASHSASAASPAALLGALADGYGVETVYHPCSFLPVIGLLAWLPPPAREGQ